MVGQRHTEDVLSQIFWNIGMKGQATLLGAVSLNCN